MTDQLRDIRQVPMEDNDAGAATVGEYLSMLLHDVWKYDEGFNGKRPFGNSGWKHEIFEALAKADEITATEDEDGFFDDYDRLHADALIYHAIELMGQPTQEQPTYEYALRLYGYHFVADPRYTTYEEAMEARERKHRPLQWTVTRREVGTKVWERVQK